MDPLTDDGPRNGLVTALRPVGQIASAVSAEPPAIGASLPVGCNGVGPASRLSIDAWGGTRTKEGSKGRSGGTRTKEGSKGRYRRHHSFGLASAEWRSPPT
ncbi:hypothetical protein B296_00018792 [Ensete ventricosum]|uniref:Uncharacterized protein n=1 Tax=Ensete ventricosum TaxID=4639 RepID=A0A426Z325_ENSVE|nr:hypothetical protein B296_00018792 [Ensete ventricosum]